MKILVTSLPDLMKMNPQRPHHLIKYLSKHHEVTVLCANAWWLSDINDSYLYDSFKNVKFHYFANQRNSSIMQELNFCAKFKIFCSLYKLNSYDLHLNLNSPLAGYLITHKLRIPTILDVYDDFPKWTKISSQIPYFLKPFGGAFGKFILNKNVQESTLVTYITELLNAAYKFPDNKARLLPNGVDTHLFCRQNSKKIKENLGLDNKFILGYVGGLKEWVDMEPVFAALSELDESTRMIIVGSEGKLDANVNLAKSYGVQNKVVFTGNVPYIQVPFYMSAMDICLIPFRVNSITDNALPMKLFEYMACEKTVISTPLAGVKDAVGDRIHYASNIDELKQKIIYLHDNNSIRSDLGSSGRAFVEGTYSWDVICSYFGELINEALNE